MSISQLTSRVIILVKALPQPSKQYGETVCCAGITADGNWKRLYPVRFRHLQGDQSFSRWDWVDFQYRKPTRDSRSESCHVHEESIRVDKPLPEKERAQLLNRFILGSGEQAAARGLSLALIRPRNTRFIIKPKSKAELQEEREAYKQAASQDDFFDDKLAELEPSPYDFRFSFEDEGGKHNYQNGDWEAHAMFFRERHRSNEQQALKWMDQVFNEDYPNRGMVFAIGNMAKRPHTWQLLGVIRLDAIAQGELELS
jgi:hypothetical protein